MKAIIDGLLYDTEKAELIARDDQRLSELYKTERNNWFTCNTGQGAYPQIEPLGRTRIDGYHHVDSDNAHLVAEWMAEAMRADLLEKHFGIKVEDA